MTLPYEQEKAPVPYPLTDIETAKSVILSAFASRTSTEAMAERAIAEYPYQVRRFMALYNAIRPIVDKLYAPDMQTKLPVDDYRVVRGVVQYILMEKIIKIPRGDTMFEVDSISRRTGETYKIVIDLSEYPNKIGAVSTDSDFIRTMMVTKHIVASLIAVLERKGILGA
jgi:hypothetical protein